MALRVLHIVDSLGGGGAQIVIKGLLEYQQDPDVSLYVLRSVRDPIAINHSKVTVSHSKSRFSLMPLLRLQEWLGRHPVDVLHCHLFRSQVFGWLLKTIIFRKMKLVFHEHGRVFGSELASAFEDRLYVTFLRIASARVDRFIAISQATRNRLINRARIKEDKISVLFNFVDPRFHDTGSCASQACGSEDTSHDSEVPYFRVGFAGRLVHRKGCHTFLGAADRVLKTSSMFRFLIAGDGPEKHTLLETIRNSPGTDHISYLGQVDNMKSFYSGLDCLVVPSLWEPQGLVEIEAQALGVPVIVSNVEALNEIIHDGENGLLFEPGDAHDLAEKILLLQSQPGLRGKLVAGGLATSRQYEVARYVLQLRELYQQLLCA